MFCFGEKFGDGSDSFHFNLGITFRKLLENVKHGKLYHIDCTYKLVRYFYPLIIFGCSDVNRTFCPIAYMITSHKTTEDFDHFFESLIGVLSIVHIVDFKPTYIMRDASNAMHNSIVKHFPNSIQLMCYFHVQLNVKKHMHLVPIDKRDAILQAIRGLHATSCRLLYCNMLKKLTEECLKDESLLTFTRYFVKQWTVGKHVRWRFFDRLAGEASTK